MWLEILILSLTYIILYFSFIRWKIHRYFYKNNVKYLPGHLVFGNKAKSSLVQRHVIDDINEVYNAFPDERYVGFIDGTIPVFLIRDPDLIKQITTKNFDHFVDHEQTFPEAIDPLFGGSMLMMKGDKWRQMRTILSATFTSSKLRYKMQFMTEISRNVVEYLNVNISSDEDLNVNELVCRYTNDVIATTDLGLQINSLKDKNNELFVFGQQIFEFARWQQVSHFIAAQFPNLAEKLKLPMFPKNKTKFFLDMVKNIIEFRVEHNIKRKDTIQLLIDASQGWTLEELSGQMLNFFISSFDSTASAITMAVHELAINPLVQERLYQEIKTFKKVNGDLNYENINELKYLDCVVNETMRKWTISLFMDRVCTKSYELPPPRECGKPILLNPGDKLYNAVNSIHMDPQYFPEPHKFEPDRFSEENKHKIIPFTFMPFGVGPRICIASKFALLEVKILLYDLFLNFKIIKGPKTADPIILDPTTVGMACVDGTHVRIEARM